MDSIHCRHSKLLLEAVHVHLVIPSRSVFAVLSRLMFVLHKNFLDSASKKKKHVREQQGQEIPEGIARYRKAVSSSLWLLVALVVCYLPYGIAAPLTPYNAFWWEINHCIYSNVYLKFSNLNKINVCKVKNIYGREKRKNTYRKLYHQSLQLLKKSNKNTVRINRTYSIVPMLLY